MFTASQLSQFTSKSEPGASRPQRVAASQACSSACMQPHCLHASLNAATPPAPTRCRPSDRASRARRAAERFAWVPGWLAELLASCFLAAWFLEKRSILETQILCISLSNQNACSFRRTWFCRSITFRRCGIDLMIGSQVRGLESRRFCLIS